MFKSRIAANGCKGLANELRTVVCERIGWDPEQDYPMIKEQLRKCVTIVLNVGIACVISDIGWSILGSIDYIVMFLERDLTCPLRQSRVDLRQGIVAVLACGGTGYSFGRSLRVVQQSYKHHWPCLDGNNCIELYRKFGVGPDVQRLEGNERESRCVGVKMAALLFVLLRPRVN